MTSNPSIVVHTNATTIEMDSKWLKWMRHQVIDHIEQLGKTCISECKSMTREMEMYTHGVSHTDILITLLLQLENTDKLMNLAGTIREAWMAEIEAIYSFKKCNKLKNNCHFLSLEQEIIELADKIETFNSAIHRYKKVIQHFQCIQNSV